MAETTLTGPAAETAAAGAGLHKRSLAGLMLAHMAVDIQTSALNVLLPPLLATFSLTYASAAAIISANNLVIAVAQPLFGVLGDYRRARWLVPLGCAVCGAAMASVMHLPSYWLVIVAVIVSGLGSAAFHPEALSATRAISGAQKATGSSLFFFAGNLGFAAGPLAAAFLLERLGAGGMVWLFAPIALGLAALATQYRRYQQGVAPSRKPGATRALLHDRRTLAVVAFLILFISVRLVVSGGLQTFIPLYFSAYSTLTKPEIAQLLTTLSIASTVGTLFSGPLADRLGRRLVIVTAMVIALGALYLFLRSDGLVRLAALAVGGAALSAPWTLSVIMMQDALPNHVGLASGLSLGTAYGAMGLGVAGLGALADVIGLRPTLWLVTALPAVVLVLGLFAPERQKAIREEK